MQLHKQRKPANHRNWLGENFISLTIFAISLILPSPALAQTVARIDSTDTTRNVRSASIPATAAFDKEGKPNNGVAGDKGRHSAESALNSDRSKPADPHRAGPEATGDKKDESTASEIELLKAQMAEQQRQIDQLRAQLEEQRKAMAIAGGPRTPDAQSAPPETSDLAATAASAAPKPAINPQKTEMEEPSPLSFRIGSAYITPVGFMDFTAIFRSTNLGSGIGTNFGGTPFSNTVAGKLDDFRFTAQNSRIGLRVDTKVGEANVLGYLEADFLGFAPTNVAVSSNSISNRLRLYWVDIRKDKFEILGGQSWSLLTPNRKGLSPIPGDIFYTQNIDTNYQAGLVWSRDPQVRFIYHPSERVALGVSLENPEQYIGGTNGSAAVTLPTALATTYSAELDNGGTTLTVPNVHPDIVAKIAFDPKIGKRDLHIEAAGLVRTFRVYNPINLQHFTATGGGGSVNLNLEMVKNFRFVTNNFYSDGGGRYIFGQAPDLIIRGDGSPSLIHSGSTVTGFEDQVTKNTLLFAYYGGIYIKRNVAIDPTNGKPVGYGYTGSPSGQNRLIHEGTFGFNKTFWKDPRYGALQFIGQYSYLLRHPWFVAVGTPRDAHASIIYLDLRYVLPGAAPKLK